MAGFSWTDLIGPAVNAAGQYYAGQQAGKAADQQAAAAERAMTMFKPWVDNGAWGINRLATVLGKDGPDAAKAAFQTSPDYQWRLDQGTKALERAASSRGLLGSGKYLKDAMDYNQNQASGEFGNSVNRLLALSGMGQSSTNTSADYLTQGANANAAGMVARANGLNNGISQGYSMYQNNQMMNRLFPGY